ncbi:hypothetical protein RP20_CCG023325 [Aedes albopictus]|nr:hypothetical protein RP20_CCG023325 [Aedes albopictus]
MACHKPRSRLFHSQFGTTGKMYPTGTCCRSNPDLTDIGSTGKIHRTSSCWKDAPNFTEISTTGKIKSVPVAEMIRRRIRLRCSINEP